MIIIETDRGARPLLPNSRCTSDEYGTQYGQSIAIQFDSRPLWHASVFNSAFKWKSGCVLRFRRSPPHEVSEAVPLGVSVGEHGGFSNIGWFHFHAPLGVQSATPSEGGLEVRLYLRNQTSIKKWCSLHLVLEEGDYNRGAVTKGQGTKYSIVHAELTH